MFRRFSKPQQLRRFEGIAHIRTRVGSTQSTQPAVPACWLCQRSFCSLQPAVRRVQVRGEPAPYWCASVSTVSGSRGARLVGNPLSGRIGLILTDNFSSGPPTTHSFPHMPRLVYLDASTPGPCSSAALRSETFVLFWGVLSMWTFPCHFWVFSLVSHQW